VRLLNGIVPIPFVDARLGPPQAGGRPVQLVARPGALPGTCRLQLIGRGTSYFVPAGALTVDVVPVASKVKASAVKR
jgi:hypothetical protein